MREIKKKTLIGKRIGLLILTASILAGCSGNAGSNSVGSTVEEPSGEMTTEETAQQTGSEQETESVEETESVVEENMNKTYTVEEAAYESFTHFIDKYYFRSKVEDYGLFLKLNFWDQAEIYEIVIDAYERTGDQRYYDMILEIFEGFTKTHKEDWSWNEFNDDVMWIVIGCTRAYNCTGDQRFLDIAVKNFDMVWDRAWSDDLGGGLWWRIENNTKNACVNCPAAIAACLLGDALDDEGYYDKAVQIIDWVVANIYEENTGHVYDAYNINGEKNSWASTYNQGTFIGANTMLYLHTGDSKYLMRARLASDYTMNDMYHYGVMNNEADGGDLPGFKGILARWMYYFSVNCDQQDVMKWLKENAMTAWSNRNSDGLTTTAWDTKAPEGDIIPFSASTMVSVLNNCKENCKTSLKAAEFNAAKEFTRCGKLVVTENNENGLTIETLTDNAYLEYATVRFAQESTKMVITAGAEADTTIELRLDAPDGELLGSTTVTAGTLENLQEFNLDLQGVKNKQKIYIVFPNGGTKVKVSGFQFGS